MLVPFETLGGTWPPVADPPILTSLGLLVGLPALVFLIIFGIGQLGSLARTGRGQEPERNTSTWVGAQPGQVEGAPRRALDAPGSGSAGSHASGPGTSGSGTAQPGSGEHGTGGAGARW